MRNILLLFLAALTCTRCWGANNVLYVTDNQGTLAGNDFVSILNLTTNKVTGNVDCNGFDMTHPIDIHFSADQLNAFVVCDNVHSVFVINVSNATVVGKVDDTINPFNAPVIIDVADGTTKAYVANEQGGPGGQGSINVINTDIDAVTDIVDDTLGPVNFPIGVSFSDDGTKAYVCNLNGHNVSVVDAATDTVTKYVNDVAHPFVQPIFAGWSGSTKVFVTDLNNGAGGFVNVVNATTDTVTGIVSVGIFPPFASPVNVVEGPDGTMYIADTVNNNIYEVNPTTNAVTHIFTGVFSFPLGIAITADNATAYVANSGNNTVSIVDLATRTQTGVVNDVAFPFHTPYQMQATNIVPTPFVPLPMRPTCIHGKQKRNRFSTQSERHNTITWCASPTQAVTQYNIFRDGALIATVNAGSTLTYSDTNIQENTAYTYSVVAVDSSGAESPAVSVTIP